MAGFHYYANAERKRTQGLAILKVRKQFERRKKITQAKNKLRKKCNEITQEIR